MGKQKRKRTPAEKAAAKRRREEYRMVFMNGKQKWIKRDRTIEGMDEESFIRRNADAIWLHQNGMWDYMDIGEEAIRSQKGEETV
jgi:hypothetical protein